MYMNFKLPDSRKILNSAFILLTIAFLVSVANIISSNIVIPFVKIVVPEVLRGYGVGGDNINIAGTGSMYPTFPKGKSTTDVSRAKEIVAWSSMRRYPGGIIFFGTRYFGYELMHGDIISFSNKLTREISMKQYGQEAGFVKRIVGLPGDKVEIKNGFVYRNGAQLKESYTARAQSTFGGSTLRDCSPTVVPQGSVFVLGDNRTASSDSRDTLGFVSIVDIDHVLSLDKQVPYSKLWRDASGDDKLVSQPTLDGKKYMDLLNTKRDEAGLLPLKWNNKLSDSATARGTKMLATNDLSFEATKSGYTMLAAMNAAGYYNITWGEAPTVGYYTEQELIDNSFNFPDSKKFLLEKDFQDVGVAAVNGNLNGCPAQIVIQHFGGYLPPNYPADTVENWTKARDNLKSVRPSWEKLKTYTSFYDQNRADIDKLLTLLEIRLRNIEAIVSRMEKNQWLTAEEKQYTSKDKEIAQEQDALANKINAKAKQ